MWEKQADGSYLGATSERAVEWSEGDGLKLAAVSFAAFCRDMNVNPQWFLDTWQTMTIPGHRPITVLLDRATKHDHFLVDNMSDPSRSDTDAVVIRVLDGTPPVVHILGFDHTHLLDTSLYPGPELPRHQLFSAFEWLNLVNYAQSRTEVAA